MSEFYFQNYFDALRGKKFSIAEKDYIFIKSSYEFILKVLWIEEKFSILLGNFYEFHESIKLTYISILESLNQEDTGQHGINLLNRRLLNLLSSARMYLDQVLHDSSSISQTTELRDLHDQIKKNTHEYYDSSVSYQVMEFMRNIMQHKFLVVRNISLVRPLFPDCDLKVVPIFVNVFLDDLKNEDNFINKIILRKEIEQFKSINIDYHSREYILKLSDLHNIIRTSLKNELGQYCKKINEFIDSLNGANNFTEIALLEYDGNKYVDGILVNRKILSQFNHDNFDALNFEKNFLPRKAYSSESCVNFRGFEKISITKNK